MNIIKNTSEQGFCLKNAYDIVCKKNESIETLEATFPRMISSQIVHVKVFYLEKYFSRLNKNQCQIKFGFIFYLFIYLLHSQSEIDSKLL
jgi:hypothetical protein